MCLIAIAAGVSEQYPLVVAANRDELHERPAAPASWWAGTPRIFGGRDLAAGGTWLAVDEHGRFAAVTNFHDPDFVRGPDTRTRGTLVSGFLASGQGAEAYTSQLAEEAHEYSPFNLLLFDRRELRYFSNRAPARRLDPGIHILTNTHFDADWPKIAEARDGMNGALQRDDPLDALLELLAPPAQSSPGRRHGRDLHRESVFIRDEAFGTRCSTVILESADRRLTFVERRFDASGNPTGDTNIIITP
jgi:uncharacterized protein with NRDE domain